MVEFMSWISSRQPKSHDLHKPKNRVGALIGAFLTSRDGNVNVEGYYCIRDEYVWARATPPDAWMHLPKPYRELNRRDEVMDWREYIDSLSSSDKSALLKEIIEDEFGNGLHSAYKFITEDGYPEFVWSATGETIADPVPVAEETERPVSGFHVNYGVTETINNYSMSVFFKEKHELDDYLDRQEKGAK